MCVFAALKEREPEQWALFKIERLGSRDGSLALQLGGLFRGWEMAQINDRQL